MSARSGFLAAARAELRAAVDRYDAQVPGLGDECAAEVEYAVAQLTLHPESGAPYLAGSGVCWSGGFRSALFTNIAENSS